MRASHNEIETGIVGDAGLRHVGCQRSVEVEAPLLAQWEHWVPEQRLAERGRFEYRMRIHWLPGLCAAVAEPSRPAEPAQLQEGKR